MQCDYAQAWAYVAALTQQSPDTAIIDVRCIHDRDDGVPAVPRRGILPELWNEICGWNSAGYGVFVNISDMDDAPDEDGVRRLTIEHVRYMRCQAVDLDNIDAQQQLNALATWQPAPAFYVNSSPGKFHVYWHTPYHADRERFSTIQRKLIAQFSSDRSIVDPSRVLRLPGTYHHKGEPHLVTCGALAGYGVFHPLEAFEAALAHIDASAVTGARQPLGTYELAAPSLEWLDYALDEIDPNNLDRGEWISLMAAYKQAGWNHAQPDELQAKFMAWCARYHGDNPAENLKNWRSIRDSEIGWDNLVRRAPAAFARTKFGNIGSMVAPPAGEPGDTPPPPANVPPPSAFSELLSGEECKQHFAGCIYVEVLNEILGPQNVFYNQSTFNASRFAGKKFVIDQQGKTTDMAWEAATRSTIWTIPKVHHTRFLPGEPHGTFIDDELGRQGVNTYMPARVKRREGNAQPFLDHVARLIPLETDRRTLFDYMAAVVQFPGNKIPWAPVIQSAEGAGKGIVKECMSHAIGWMYCHFPNAHEMANSGSKFNAWMRNKLFILCDEIRVDERRDMIEILKPMISEKRIEVQGKGVDQIIEDNFSNWMFFTNYKDAVPVSANARRFAIFYSPLQTAADIIHAGMGKEYFDALWLWLENGGFEIVTDWLMRYPIERSAIPMRAPLTSSTDEAIRATRSPLEQMIIEAVDEGLAGFRGGYVSVPAVAARAKAIGMRTPTARTVQSVLEALGYSYLGRAPGNTAFEQQPVVYAIRPDMPLAGYAPAQGLMVPAPVLH